MWRLYRWRWPIIGAVALGALVIYARLNPTYEGVTASSPMPRITAAQ
jgi:hypothetical protein